MRRTRPCRRVAAAAALAASALLAGGAGRLLGNDGPDDTVDAFLAGWPAAISRKVGFVDRRRREDRRRDVATQIKALSGELASSPPVLTAQGKPKVDRRDRRERRSRSTGRCPAAPPGPTRARCG